MSEVGTPPPHDSDKPHGLVDSINNNNNSPGGKKSINPLFYVPTSQTIVNHVQTIMSKHSNTPEAINNFYELPSIDTTIRYIHAEADFPKKSTWIKAIRQVNCLTLPLINTKNVTKILLEYE